jgi:F-box/WD-40 domain protein MET30
MHSGGALGMDIDMDAADRREEKDVTDEMDKMDVVPLRANRQLCVRHKQMANQDVNQKLQRVSILSGHEAESAGEIWSARS